ncbi:MAG: glycerol-3-phosphate 1-O-acyltransferase [Bacteroidetes bacterium]|nr:glycerol-3-phosphate 1-O-acyltransferase [Bacteroidota bacterium]
MWYGKTLYKIDVREHGSGNAGATNTLRVLGNKAGFIVLFIDMLKGFIATSLVYFTDYSKVDSQFFKVQMALGVVAVIGHVFPLFANFRGGKGIATIMGMAISLDYRIALICTLLFILIVWGTKYISVGSMFGAVAGAMLSFYFYGTDQPIVNGFFIALSMMVIYTHRANIKRLMVGNENKFAFKKSN